MPLFVLVSVLAGLMAFSARAATLGAVSPEPGFFAGPPEEMRPAT